MVDPGTRAQLRVPYSRRPLQHGIMARIGTTGSIETNDKRGR